MDDEPGWNRSVKHYSRHSKLGAKPPSWRVQPTTISIFSDGKMIISGSGMELIRSIAALTRSGHYLRVFSSIFNQLETAKTPIEDRIHATVKIYSFPVQCLAMLDR